MLPGLGGRLWSLRDLVTERDLVFTNRRLQFANLALTDAWFAGGIEWNLGSTGHSATTSRPVFAGSVPSDRGTALRIWEWERTRDLVFSVDLLMPADRRLLLAFVRVRNPDPEPKPLYWWTNIAVPEEPGVRVVAPGNSSLADRVRRIHHRCRHPLRRRPGHRCQLPAAGSASRGLLLPGATRATAVDRVGAGRRPGADPDLHRCVARPKAVLLGYRRRRPALAGVAVRTRFPLSRDPGRSGQHATRAPSAGGERRDQLGGGVRADRSGPGTRYTVLGRRRSPRSPGWSLGRFPRTSSTNGIAGGEQRWPRRRHSS